MTDTAELTLSLPVEMIDALSRRAEELTEFTGEEITVSDLVLSEIEATYGAGR